MYRRKRRMGARSAGHRGRFLTGKREPGVGTWRWPHSACGLATELHTKAQHAGRCQVTHTLPPWLFLKERALVHTGPQPHQGCLNNATAGNGIQGPHRVDLGTPVTLCPWRQLLQFMPPLLLRCEVSVWTTGRHGTDRGWGPSPPLSWILPALLPQLVSHGPGASQGCVHRAW